MPPHYRDAIARVGVLDALNAFDPHVAGTPPLGLDLPGSDIDILCHAPDAGAFEAVLRGAFSARPGFAVRRWSDQVTVIATFTAQGWPFEIFGQPLPVAQQQGWRHFQVERTLLAMGGDPFRAAVMAYRRDGLKTEPAIAAVLGLEGDPYRALLAIAGQEREALTAGFSGQVATLKI